MSGLLHHVALGARDVERVAAFYERAFELPRLARHEDEAGALRSVWLGLGDGAVLMIERTVEEPRPVSGVGAGPFLLAFAVDPEARVCCEARLAEAGAPVEARTAHSSYARDPEGNRVAVSSYQLPREGAA